MRCAAVPPSLPRPIPTCPSLFFFNDTATTEIYTLSLHDALPIWRARLVCFAHRAPASSEVHRRVFGPAVEFGHEFNGIVCNAADLDAPNPGADPVMARYTRQLLDTRRGAPRALARSEERRVGKECRSRWSPYH